MAADRSVMDEVRVQAVGLQRVLLIVVDRTGPFLAASHGEGPHRLDLSDLRALVTLARGEGSTLDPARHDDPLWRALEARELLGAGGPVAELPGLPAPTPIEVPADRLAETLVLVCPVALRLGPGGFEHLDHDGRVQLRLSPIELMAACAFGEPTHLEDARAAHLDRLGADALDTESFDRLAQDLEAVGLLARAGADGEDTAEGKMIRSLRRGFELSARRAAHVDRWLAQRRAEEDERAARTGRRRIRVVPVTNGDVPLLSLGLVMSYAQAFDGGRLNDDFEFVGDWMNRTVPSLAGDEPPAVFLYSNYLWSHAWNLGSASTVKAANPAHITVHGGPDTPKYEGDVQTYFAANPQVDVAVHGEGEATLAELLDALRPSLAAGAPDLSALADVPGLSYRDGDRVVRTASRDRLSDLDIVPSPFDNGLFDSVGDLGLPYLIIETNRGCPYGCTYCDWGSATLSRIRQFDLDRVFHDLEWAARNKVEVIWNADANFGVFKRDVDIARKVVELKKEYGYPRLFGANYAKNTVKHLRQIVDTLVDGGILATGVLSMQSADPETLLTIRRSNIKVDRYDDLADEFSRNELPLVTELMMGLPGSTLTSFTQDLQQCIDREMRARVYPTELLINSPMNEPDYRETNRIETVLDISDTWVPSAEGGRRAPFVVSTSSFSRDDYRQMDRFRQHFFLFENYGVLRQVSRFVRQETAIREMDLYRQMEDAVTADRDRWPTLAFTFESLHNHLIAPASWRLFIDELRDYLTGPLGIADDSALDTVLEVQHALLPARDRTFPYRIDLAHDFAAWHRTMLELKRSGSSQDWITKAPRLVTYGPGHLEVEDPQSIGRDGMGEPLLSSNEADWELASPVGRTLTFLQSASD